MPLPERARRFRGPRQRILPIVVCAFAVALVQEASADVYYFIDEYGSAHYSDQATDARYRPVPDSGGTSAGTRAQTPRIKTVVARSRAFEAEIRASALANDVDPALLHALVDTESGYNTRAVSRRGALGLTQLMPDTARRYGVVDPFDAAQNLAAGARYLRELLDLFANDRELALAAYNAGAGAVLAHGRRIPPYAETRLYVPAVLGRYEQLRHGDKPEQATAGSGPVTVSAPAVVAAP